MFFFFFSNLKSEAKITVLLSACGGVCQAEEKGQRMTLPLSALE